MTRPLLDANLGPRTASYLSQRFGFEASSLIVRGLDHLSDEEIVALAIDERSGIVTFDLDFGEIFHRQEHGQFGAIIIRTRDQTVDRVNRALEAFFEMHAMSIALERSLVVIDEGRVRIDTTD